MLDNFVLIQLGGQPWTLGAVCFAAAGVLFVVWLALLPGTARRIGTIRRMTTEEAAKLSLVGITPSYDAPSPLVWGPAAGKEWRVDMTIGDFRSLWRRGARGMFFGVAMFLALLPLAVAVAGYGVTLLLSSGLFLAFTGFGALLIVVLLIMLWAAVYTQLE